MSLSLSFSIKTLRIVVLAFSSSVLVTACGGGSGGSSGPGIPDDELNPDSPPVMPATNDGGASESPVNAFAAGNDVLNGGSADDNDPVDDVGLVNPETPVDDVTPDDVTPDDVTPDDVTPDDVMPDDVNNQFADGESGGSGEMQGDAEVEVEVEVNNEEAAGGNAFLDALQASGASSTTDFVELSGSDFQTGSVEDQGIALYETDAATSIVVVSLEGDADLVILDENRELVCGSELTGPIDFCTDLVIGEQYFIGVGGFTEADFEIFSTNTTPIAGNSAFASTLVEEEILLFVGRGFTAANLLSFEGDSDLQVVNTAGEVICESNSVLDFDSCNNVDGSSSPAIDKNELYIVVVEGFSDVNFELKTFDADVLSSNIPEQSSVAEDEEDVYFAQGVSTFELSTFSGDADLVVYNSITNEQLCFSFQANLDADECLLPVGNYRIEIVGHLASDYSLVVF